MDWQRPDPCTSQQHPNDEGPNSTSSGSRNAAGDNFLEPQVSPSPFQGLLTVKLEEQLQPPRGTGRDPQLDMSTPRSPSRGSVPGDDTKEGIQTGPRASLKLKKGDAFDLPPSVVEAYLRDMPRFSIHPLPNLVGIKRKVMRLTYGGSDRQLVQYLAANKNPSSNAKRNLGWPMPDDHPVIPHAPGEPGLMFAGRTELRRGIWSVFTRNANKTSAEWTYMGEYENTLVGTMTKEQFIWQSYKVSCAS